MMTRKIRTTARRIARAMGRALSSYAQHMVVVDPTGQFIYPAF
jgi:hypothetical protein